MKNNSVALVQKTPISRGLAVAFYLTGGEWTCTQSKFKVKSIKKFGPEKNCFLFFLLIAHLRYCHRYLNSQIKCFSYLKKYIVILQIKDFWLNDKQ